MLCLRVDDYRLGESPAKAEILLLHPVKLHAFSLENNVSPVSVVLNDTGVCAPVCVLACMGTYCMRVCMPRVSQCGPQT